MLLRQDERIPDSYGEYIHILHYIIITDIFWNGCPGVHTMVSLLAAARVRTLAQPSPYQLGLETSTIRKRLSIASVRASCTLLLSRMGQVGEGSGLASSRRSWQRQEERRMMLQRESDWLVTTSGREVVRRGQFWR